MLMQKFTGLVRRCVEDYSMIDEGDVIAIGVSGGKDSICLLRSMAELRKYNSKHFTIHGLTVDMGFGSDYGPIAQMCAELDISYTVSKTQIGDIIFKERKEKNPCALCSKMRRGVLHDAMKDLGIKKIALGHHFDDAVETFVMSLFFEGRINCFEPVTYMSRSDVTQIRPMLYVGEGTAESLVRRYNLPVVKNPCPRDGVSKRTEVKELIKTLSAAYPDMKSKIFGAMQRYPLSGWEPGEYKRH